MIKLENRDTVQDIDSIVQKILFIIGTRRKSRKWRENFGTDVYTMLFEPFDDTTAGWIQTYIRDALESPYNGLTNDVTGINVSVERAVDQTYLVSIAFRVPALEQTKTVQFSMRSMA
ncbi:hypothetical protein YOLOSWAG_106 [Erwinia phage vB_EamM_Yoloswag]|uniref:IraD/Gp25-like domain-containing protein n=1 Tax=Erwinia phage vB_EamM_Yoloswag TaxID=1958956 RepID=A0A1S6L331_9CAUD|nr:hypothetical protein HOR66_gp106 [Erwinia phage vB_EamM_Yoloswag]AQT28588.1 hypothetical protein YOLOSWAG_106 [Erwinia phage vB_EamM_Yoloswag]